MKKIFPIQLLFALFFLLFSSQVFAQGAPRESEIASQLGSDCGGTITYHLFDRNCPPCTQVLANFGCTAEQKRTCPKRTLEFNNGQCKIDVEFAVGDVCLLYTSPSPRDKRQSRMPSSA